MEKIRFQTLNFPPRRICPRHDKSRIFRLGGSAQGMTNSKFQISDSGFRIPNFFNLVKVALVIGVIGIACIFNIYAAKDTRKDDFDIDAFGIAVRSQYLEINQKVLKNQIKGIELSLYSQIYQEWAEHPYIEEAVRIQKFWFSNLAKLMKEMSGCKTQMEVYAERGKKELYQTAKEKYVILLKKFKEYVEKPPRLQRSRKRG